MDLLSHWLFPLIALILYDQLKYNKILLSSLVLSVFAILPDFDVFLGTAVHRTFSHSIFIPIIILLIAVIFRLKDSKYARCLFVISFFLFSHLLLDLSYGGIPLLYPFSEDFVTAELEVSTYSSLVPLFHFRLEKYTPQASIDWRYTTDPDIKPGVIAWRNTIAIMLLFAGVFLASIKRIKVHNDFVCGHNPP
jgi:membrane-bound metal-dependent hydrolase YbcI (DUF457 family)